VPIRLTDRYQRIVSQFEGCARANLGTLTRVQELCRAANLEPHTLLRAFHAVHNTTPHRYLRSLRLALARNALLSSGPSSETVTEIAMRFGFHELGRFSSDYRSEFGESPSETLRRALSNEAFSSQCPEL
jgi:AraC family ethanolamine operon transcriptional activator